MLYDKRWEKPEVKADPFSLESLISWLEKQPADERYDYQNCDGRCMYGQYMRSYGYEWSEINCNDHEHAEFRIAVYDIACEEGWTFGAALERTREALKSAP